MSRTKKSKPGGGRQGEIDAKNEKKRKREEREEKKAQDSTPIGDESIEVPKAKKTKKNNDDTRKDDENIPTHAAEQASEEQPTKGPATTASGSAPQIFGDLANLHDILIVSAISSSKIQKKTTAVLKHLATHPAVPPSKPALVLAHSKADTTAKLITIIEIAKRDIGSSGGKWFQYNVVYQVMEQQKEKKKKRDDNKDKDTAEADDGQEEDEDEEEKLETMKTPFERAIEGQPKVRAIPHMAIYLSRTRIESLGKKYGEQTNAVEVPGAAEIPHR